MGTTSIPVSFVTTDPEQLARALSCREVPSKGEVFELDPSISFAVESTTESHGFAVSELVVQGLVTIAAGVSTDLLSEWLKNRIWPHRDQIKVRIRGKALEDCDVNSIRERLGEQEDNQKSSA